ncbi:MAG: ABC transporter substrate-binding protein [Firmicutes bacterium HGW-Firmicutes-3]|jgi:NitT/TauT family transport system substrate-binding protein|nr:MAG: ABC transporter substrate-binding protein [Firmicutes bacterium HGW-Firmicutes-3]
MKKMMVIIFSIIMGLSGCNNQITDEIIIAEQYGLAYAPLQVMKEKGFLEDELKGDRVVKWVKLANTAAIREAMLSDQLDIGFMGIPPFLIGVDQEMPWKIMTGLSQSPVGLITDQVSIKNLEDLIQKGQIALPQPGSIQHILLAMALDKQMGQSNLLDHQLIAMNHPEGYQALIGETQVVAQFTTPPYLFDGLNTEGIHMILDGEEAMGEPFTFIVGVCQDSFYQEEASYESFLRALDRAYIFMEDEKSETLTILSKSYGLEEDVLESYLYEMDMIYGKEVLGVERFISFMRKEGYISKDIRQDDVLWD